MSEWKEFKLGDISDVRDGTHDSPKEKPEGRFLITSKHIKNGKIDFSSAYRISEEDFDQINKRSKVDKWDILFSMIGTIAETVIVDFEPDFAIKNVGLFKTGDKNLSKWIYYYLKSTDAKNEIDACLKGSTQQYITLGDLRNFPIKIPPLPEQKAIAEVLTSLDDKIDLLHKQNKTLEQLAETLFRHHFINNAKDDWEVGKLGDCFTISYGKNLPTNQLLESGYPVFGGNGQIGFFDKFLYADPQVLVSCRGEASGKVNISLPNSFVTNNSLVLVRDKKPEISFEFLKYFALNYDFSLHVSGSAQPQITIDGLYDAEFVMPSSDLVKEYSNVVGDIEEKRLLNFYQIKNLEKLRDQLLPKLMSGEITLKKQ